MARSSSRSKGNQQGLYQPTGETDFRHEYRNQYRIFNFINFYIEWILILVQECVIQLMQFVTSVSECKNVGTAGYEYSLIQISD